MYLRGLYSVGEYFDILYRLFEHGNQIIQYNEE